MCISKGWVVPRSSASLLHHYPGPDIVLQISAVSPVPGDFVYSLLVEWEEGFGEDPCWYILFDQEGEGSSAVDMELAEGVCLVSDPFQDREPFGDRVAVEGPDTVAEESIGVGIDHVVPDGQ